MNVLNPVSGEAKPWNERKRSSGSRVWIKESPNGIEGESLMRIFPNSAMSNSAGPTSERPI
jgi:hypothetical protein